MNQSKVLIVDDDPDMRMCLQIRLQANNYSVVCAGDAIAGVAEARKHMPDLIVLDLGLPAGDGFVVMERLKSSIELASIPVVIVSARDRAANKERSMKAGARAFLQKPVNSNQLLSVIRQVLGQGALDYDRV